MHFKRDDCNVSLSVSASGSGSTSGFVGSRLILMDIFMVVI